MAVLHRPLWCMIRRNKPQHAPIPRAANKADGQSAPNHYRRGIGRHARVLRLLPDRLRRGVHCRAVEAHIWRIRRHFVVFGLRRDVWRRVLRLACGQDRPPQSFPHDGDQFFDRHRHSDVYAGQCLGFPLGLPFPDRIWRGRPVLRGPSAGAGVRAGFQARHGRRAGDRCRPHRRPHGRRARRICHAVRGLAGSFCDWHGSWAAHAPDSRLGAGIAALADPDGANRGGQEIAGVGPGNGSCGPPDGP